MDAIAGSDDDGERGEHDERPDPHQRAEMAKRRKAWKAPPPPMDRGYVQLYHQHVLQADKGVDLDFLVGKSVAAVPRDCPAGA